MPQQNTSFNSIKYNDSRAIPRYIISLHCEVIRTDCDPAGVSVDHQFRLGTAITTRIVDGKPKQIKIHRLRHQEDFWQLICDFTRQNFTTWIVAHDMLSQFVYLDMKDRIERCDAIISWPRKDRYFDHLPDGHKQQQTLSIIDNPPTIIALQCLKTQGRFVMVDTRNWFSATIAELGDSCGTKQIEQPADDASNEDWAKYSFNSCEIVFRSFVSLVKWQSEHDLGLFRYTAASQAMAGYRHRFMNTPIYTHDVPFVRKLERASYSGGRLIVKKIGRIDGPIYQLDVNSLFPSVMLDGLFPSALLEYEDNHAGATPDFTDNSIGYTARVKLFTEAPDYPVRARSKSLYPVGTFDTVLSCSELSDAQTKGRIEKCYSWASYKTKPLFSEFVGYFWMLRQRYKAQRLNLYDTFAKLMLNSLYGKFAQRSSEWCDIASDLSNLPWAKWIEKDRLTNEIREFRSFGWKTQQKFDRGEKHGTFIAISAFVTSYARTRMNNLRATAGESNCFYQAMDCLFVNQQGYDNLLAANEVQEDQIGKLRLVCESPSMTVLGNNHYEIGGRMKAAGVNEIDNTKEGVVYHTRQKMVLQSIFSRDGSSNIKEARRKWNKLRDWAHGKIGDDGWTTPFDASEIEDLIGVQDAASN